jgi:hypothetical protein
MYHCGKILGLNSTLRLCVLPRSIKAGEAVATIPGAYTRAMATMRRPTTPPMKIPLAFAWWAGAACAGL